jgi:MFS family permease
MSDHFTRDHLRVATFLSGTGLSVIGNMMAMVALPWFVLQTTGSATQTGLTGMATALPSFLSGIFGGPLVDRLGGRRMSVVADLVSAAAIFAIPALYQTVGLEFWQLFVLVLLGALLDVPGFTARRTLLPGFSRRANMQPEAVNTSFEMLQSISFIAGPAIAGVLIGPMGAVNLLWLTGIGFLISAVTVYGVVPDEIVDPEPNAPRLSYRQQIAEGLSFIGRDRLLLSMAVVFGLSNFLANGFHGVGLPVIIHERFEDASRFGLLISAAGIGTLLGASIYGAIGHNFRTKRRAIVLFGFMTQPLFMLPFVWDSPFLLLLVSSALAGLVIGPINPLSVTVRFERTPARLHGRVFATYSAISAVATPLGLMLAGYMFDGLGIQASMAILTMLYGFMALCLPAIGALHEMNIDEEAEPKPAT